MNPEILQVLQPTGLGDIALTQSYAKARDSSPSFSTARLQRDAPTKIHGPDLSKLQIKGFSISQSMECD